MRKIYLRIALIVGAVLTLSFCVSTPGNPPAYLHALSDLRAARWLISHHPANWANTKAENEAVREIDRSINEIKQAAIDDGKNTEWHPDVDEQPDRSGRLTEALDFLNKAQADIGTLEEHSFANWMRNHAVSHINFAIQETRRALEE